MEETILTTVTIIFYNEHSLELQHDVKDYPKNKTGRIIIPAAYKEGKSIIAVCLGEITIINKVGDRIMSVGITE